MPWSRIISGIVAIALALTATLLGGWYFTMIFAVGVFLGQKEYFNLVRAKGIAPTVKTTMVVSQILLVICTLDGNLADAVMPLAGTFICFYLVFQPKMASIADIAASILGLFYTGYLPSYWVRLRAIDTATISNLPLGGYLPFRWEDILEERNFASLPQGLTATLLTFLCIWAADIGAYIVGKFFGKTPLSSISPRKTVEGAVFGITACIVVAVAGAYYLNWPKYALTGMALGLLIGISSLLGDLTESMLKRDAGVKDSGQLIPGHGGVLDRTDSYIFTAPLVYYFVTLLLPLLT
ncbi:MAG: phosphatidate cytidylyltransferase [Cyanomargarita calcarea GSE-NOS-MK-12-04C]|jgi:phosphatidate cytidylyltransferase|uniref:Phosphatidate cytidylyltransferase n=1 Tax=Cyanomargarita calcarea GSE-NOS-MK-12-04C TaxID=2839659 RepID=A0A951QIQ3_9CYAN|nr:phosphatidate cytidylyltransferase [Cyanomargarita calcarea GSE-NOS-MK-12-04C]